MMTRKTIIAVALVTASAFTSQLSHAQEIQQSSVYADMYNNLKEIGCNLGNLAWKGLSSLPAACSAVVYTAAKATGLVKTITEHPMLATATGAAVAAGYYLKKHNASVFALVKETEDFLKQETKSPAPLYWCFALPNGIVQDPYSTLCDMQETGLIEYEEQFIASLNASSEYTKHLCSCRDISIGQKFKEALQGSIKKLDVMIQRLRPHCSVPSYIENFSHAFDDTNFDSIVSKYNEIQRMIHPDSWSEKAKMYFVPAYAARASYLRALGVKMVLDYVYRIIVRHEAELKHRESLNNNYSQGYCQSEYCCNK